MIAQLMSLFQNDMMIDISIEDAYQMGSGSPRQIVITFSSVTDRSNVLENSYRVKDLTNSQGNKLFFKKYHTAPSNERIKFNKEIEAAVQEMDEVSRPEVTYQKGDIHVGGKPYTQTGSSTKPITNTAHESR